MKDERMGQVSRGLRLIFVGELLGAAAAIPGLSIAALAGLVVGLVGLVKAGQGEAGYQRALYCTVGSLALNMANYFTPAGGVLELLLDLGVSLLNFLTVYIVCTVTCSLLSGWDDQLAEKGQGVWKLYGGALAAAAACSVAAGVFALGATGAGTAVAQGFLALVVGVVTILAMIILLVAMVLYMIFLYRASRDLEGT